MPASLAAAQPFGSQDGAVGHRFRPGDVFLDRHRQSASHQAAQNRPDRRADHVVGHLADLQQPLHSADVDETRTTPAAEHRDELLVSDLGVQFCWGEVISVALDEDLPLIVLVGRQARQRLACRSQRRDRIRFLAQRSVERVGDPGPPRGDFGTDRDVSAPAASARSRRGRLKVGEPGEVEDVAQLAQLVCAQDVRGGELMPDQPVFHPLQQQVRLGGRQIGGVDGFGRLVLDLLDEFEPGPAAAEAAEQRVGERDLHEDQSRRSPRRRTMEGCGSGRKPARNQYV